MRTLILTLLLSFCVVTAEGTSFAHPLTMADLIGCALENRPETSSAFWRAERAAAALGRAESDYYPGLNFNAGVSHGRDFKFINGPDTNYTVLNADITLSWLLYDFGETSSSVEALKETLYAAKWQSKLSLQKVMIDVLKNGYLTLLAEKVLEAAVASCKDVERMLEVAENLNRAGLRSISDLYSAQAALYEMRAEVAEKKSALKIQKARLAVSCGFSPDVEVPLSPVDDIPLPRRQTIHDLLALARLQRADLQSKWAEVAAALALEKKAGKSYLPKISLSGRGGAEHAVKDKASAAHYGIALSIDFPLFDGFATAYEQRLAQADVAISRDRLAELELEIALDIHESCQELELAVEIGQFSDDQHQNALNGYQAVLEKYQAGSEGISDLLIAEKQLLRARLRKSEAKTKILLSAARLAYATGTLCH